MYTFNQITHIHILFSLWPSETNSKNMRYTHAQSYTHIHMLEALRNDKHSDKYTWTYQYEYRFTGAFTQTLNLSNYLWLY